MPGGRYGDGLVLLSHLRRRYRELRLVLYTMVDNPALLLAIVKQGTSGVVSKSDSLTHLVDAVHAAHGGRQYYSPTIKDMLLNSMMVAEQQADAARGRNRPAVLRRQHHHRNRRAAAPQRADRQYPEAQRHAQAGREPRRGLDQDVHRRSLSSAAGALFTGAARSRRFPGVHPLALLSRRPFRLDPAFRLHYACSFIRNRVPFKELS